ncbi:uncharacterized protein LOC142990322 isoform X2 [Genypterus blacodes]|uniref:uncharacterized protein LOC142990322 isoform X2 n=1 Tax=Genypterus blacodes TaxID=154954 RepID=UPI003F759156
MTEEQHGAAELSFDQQRPASPAPSGVSMQSDWSKEEPLTFRNKTPSSFDQQRPASPAPSGVSMQSDWSKEEPLTFRNKTPSSFDQQRPASPAPSGVSMQSDWSMEEPLTFRNKTPSSFDQQRPASPAPSGVSMQSDWSKEEPLTFRNKTPSSFDQQRPASPAPSGVSMQSDWSMEEPLTFRNKTPSSFDQQRPASPAPSGVSMQSDWSKEEPLTFRNKTPSSFDQQRPASPAPSGVSMQSDWSKEEPLTFRNKTPSSFDQQRPASPAPSGVSMQSDWSKEEPLNFRNKTPSPAKAQQQRDSPVPSSTALRSDQEHHDVLNFTPGLEEEKEKTPLQKLTSALKETILLKYEEDLHQKQTQSELYLAQKKKKLLVPIKYDELFKLSKGKPTVLTKGVEGVGKTFQSRMFMVDWARGRSNKDIDLLIPLQFSDLNSKKDEVQSMEELLDRILRESKELGVSNYDNCNVAFVLDGLEKCELPLKSKKKKVLTDMREKASLDVLLTSLIQGSLLPTARLWILTQHAGAKKIPDEYIHNVTECRAKDAKPKLIEGQKERILKDYKEEVSKKVDSELCSMQASEDNQEAQQAKLTTYQQIFQSKSTNRLRTVLTKGVGGIGKTFQTRKFMVDWAGGRLNKDIDLLIPLHFSDLKSRNAEDQSMEDLLHHFLKEARKLGYSSFDDFTIAFVLDGLEKCELPLDFKTNKGLTDMREAASLDVLLTSLIKGTLLPAARLWIISQHAGAKKIPDEYIHKVTECRAKDAKPKLIQGQKERILKDYKEEVSKNVDSELCSMQASEDNQEAQQAKLTTYQQIFQSKSTNRLRTVLTKGVGGIGKTFQTRKFMVDWAGGRLNKDIDLLIPLHFSDLKSRNAEDQSMEDLLHHFLKKARKLGYSSFDDFKVAFVLDGLEKCELPLDFKTNKGLTDMREEASLDVLLTSLIKGTLLPAARLWIISQHAGAKKIPDEYIHKVTECRESVERQKKLASKMKQRALRGITQAEDFNHPNQKNTEHIIRAVRKSEASGQSEETPARKVTSTSEIFKHGNDQTLRTVLTFGEGDIGKTFHANKLIRDWAKDSTWTFSRLWNQTKAIFYQSKDDVEFVIPLPFSRLNVFKGTKVSLVGLFNNVFEETKEHVISDYAVLSMLLVFDGLDKFEPPLDFDHEVLTDIREPASVGVLLTNLIKGNLLPSAKLWITSRPSPDIKLCEEVDRVTEIREKPDVVSHRKIKHQLMEEFKRVSEGIDKQKTSALLSEIYTDLYIVEGERGEVNQEHETRQVQDAKFKPMAEETPIKYQNIFKPAPGEERAIRTVLTNGVAGIGKTIASMKYMLDWAEGTANQDTYYTFPFPFRELNLRKDKEYSFEELLHQFFPFMKTSEISDYNKYKILIVLDGLDECRLDLDFNEKKFQDVKAPTSVNVLLTNLIQGNLLPKAQIWITSRPAASNCIPPKNVDRVTEVRGFNDEQKKEYFGKRFPVQDLAEKIFSHVKKSRSLYIMCHIPVFCWITAKVLENLVETNHEGQMPKTLTDMYIYFLLLQCKQANVKYGEGETECETQSGINTKKEETILSLGKLAFEELEKGNLFTEERLTECLIDIKDTTIYSGLLTQILRDSHGIYPQKLFCFVHLSIQEFMAALYVTHTFLDKGENVLSDPASTATDLPASDFYKTAVDKALGSKTGDWDLVLRFLLGLSLETNQALLQELGTKGKNSTVTNKETIDYIKEKIREEFSKAEQNINLFHCLIELNDDSLLEEVKKYLRSGSQDHFKDFSPSQWSALTFVLLTSDENLDLFDLKKYLKSEEVLLGMLPVVKVSRTTLLSWCWLSEKSCAGLSSSVLTSPSSNLTTLDLSHNDLKDAGVKLLSDGLTSLHCKLETLKLSGCQVSGTGCESLASALVSNTSSTLKELDLSYNHPGESGRMKLTAIAEDPSSSLEKLCLDHCGEHRLKPGLKKYAVYLTFNENTMSKRLFLSEEKMKVHTETNVEKKKKMSNPEHVDRFRRSQVLCQQALTGFCYWELEWSGTVGIAVAYNEVSRKWDSSGGLGCNGKSWSLLCSKTSFTVVGLNQEIRVSAPCHKIAMFLDWDAGTLTYYNVSSGALSHIHTFKARFTEALYAGFWFKKGSVRLCHID